MRWSFFFGACILAAYVLLSSGAPPAAVAAGMALAALLNLMKRHKGSSAVQHNSGKNATTAR